MLHFFWLLWLCSHNLQELNASHSVIKQELHHLTDTEVPSLVRELATFQSTTVLTGDYSLKLARQDYFTSNQNQVCKNLGGYLHFFDPCKIIFLKLWRDVLASYWRPR